MTRRAVVVVFHKEWQLCRSRVRLLRALNPDIAVHAILGGSRSEHAEATACLESVVDSSSSCRLGDGRWQWQHTDLVIRDWHRHHGRAHAFDVLHVMQWDLLLFAPLAHLYRHVPPEAIALTGLTALEEIRDRWYWTTAEPHGTEAQALFESARIRWPFTGEGKACLGPGMALPRSFLDRYADEDIPELGHDELRVPLFGEIFGHDLIDTGFYPRWFDPDSECLFNANGLELTVPDVRRELNNRHGRRAFHPCRLSFTEELVHELRRTTTA